MKRLLAAGTVGVLILMGTASAFPGDDRASLQQSDSARAILAALAQRHGAAATEGSTQAAHSPESAGALTPDQAWEALMEGNRRYVAGHPRTREFKQTRRRLVAGQKPPAIVLGCSDSRCPPEILFDQNLGDVFVIRTAGEIADPVALGSIEYAVEHLKSSVLVVLGHEKCGAVAAAVSGDKMPTPNLEALISRVRPALLSLRGAHGDELARLGVEANVRRSAADVLSMSSLIRGAVTAGHLRLVRAVYRLADGDVVTLN